VELEITFTYFIREVLKSEVEQGKIKFPPLLKEVFWLTELELTIKGKSPIHSFEGITKSANKDHIIHDAYKLILSPNHNKEKDFITLLKKHLSSLK